MILEACRSPRQRNMQHVKQSEIRHIRPCVVHSFLKCFFVCRSLKVGKYWMPRRENATHICKTLQNNVRRGRS